MPKREAPLGDKPGGAEILQPTTRALTGPHRRIVMSTDYNAEPDDRQGRRPKKSRGDNLFLSNLGPVPEHIRISQAHRLAAEDTIKTPSHRKLLRAPKAQLREGDDDPGREVTVIDNVTGERITPTRHIEWPESTDRGPTKHSSNLRYFLANVLGAEVWLNTFSNQCHIRHFKNFDLLNDAAIDALFFKASDQGLRWPADFFAKCLFDLARQNDCHPVREYLDGLQWDGEPRVEGWLVDYAGSKDTPYVNTISKLALIAAVRRVKQPGCKFDAMLVLESPKQGVGKSTTVRVLAGDDWFTDSVELGLDPKQMIEQTQGKWFVEVAELTGMGRKDIDRIKTQLSRTSDRGRLVYNRVTSEVPRQFIMIGTVNPEAGSGYLRDQTGNRRFWPVEVGKVDIDALRRDRDQIWAEAVHLERLLKYDLALPEKLREVAAEEQEARLSCDPLEEQLAETIDGAPDGFVSSEVLYSVIGLAAGADGTGVSKRLQKHKSLIERVMRKHGWRPSRPRLLDGTRPNGYLKGPKVHRLALSGRRLVPAPPRKAAP